MLLDLLYSFFLLISVEQPQQRIILFGISGWDRIGNKRAHSSVKPLGLLCAPKY